jgi:hypothetical protein
LGLSVDDFATTLERYSPNDVLRSQLERKGITWNELERLGKEFKKLEINETGIETLEDDTDTDDIEIF